MRYLQAMHKSPYLEYKAVDLATTKPARQVGGKFVREQVVDGFQTKTGDLVLVKDEVDVTTNAVYEVLGPGQGWKEIVDQPLAVHIDMGQVNAGVLFERPIQNQAVRQAILNGMASGITSVDDYRRSMAATASSVGTHIHSSLVAQSAQSIQTMEFHPPQPVGPTEEEVQDAIASITGGARDKRIDRAAKLLAIHEHSVWSGIGLSCKCGEYFHPTSTRNVANELKAMWRDHVAEIMLGN